MMILSLQLCAHAPRTVPEIASLSRTAIAIRPNSRALPSKMERGYAKRKAPPCFCYCGAIGHKSLHSRYEDEHSAGCTVCVDSALLASELKKQALGDAEIRNRLIAKYGSRTGR